MAKRGKNVHGVKQANKHLNKLKKRGQLKKKNKGVKSGRVNKKNDVQQNREDSDNEQCDPSDMFEKEDLDHIITKHYQKKKNGVKRMVDDEGGNTDDDDGAEFEARPRKWFGKDNNNKITKVMLPIKEKSGIVPQYLEMEIDKEDDVSSEEESKTVDEETQAEIKPHTTVELYVNRSNKIASRKLKIAHYATKILENPQENIKCLKELRLMMDDKDRDVFVTTRKLVAASLLEIFKDILPDYHIRKKSDEEPKQQLKKETKILLNFEDGLLRNYQGYLQRLETMLQGLKLKKRHKDVKRLSKDPLYTMGSLAVKCLCELLISRPSFNYRNNVIHLLIPFLNYPDDEISDLVCSSFQRLFKEDKLGAVTLECVQGIGRLVKEKNFLLQPKVLNTLLHLKIKEAIVASEEKKKQTKDRYKMSRSERKRQKQMAQLERSLRETQGQENKDERTKYQTDILSQVFLMYFKILKKATKSVLIPSVLEGLAKYAHLINVEFFDDLISCLHSLIESGDLAYRENMHCVQTVFTILSGQGSSLNIDPLRFYVHLYKHLFHLHSGDSSEDIPILLACLDLMFTKRKKQISLPRLLAFIKRLCVISLQVNHDGAIGLLMAVRSLMQCHKQSDILLDIDASLGSGAYLPELEEPEHCNANTTALWELHLLTRHYHPLVQTLAKHLLRGAPVVGDGQLSVELTKMSPEDLWSAFSMSAGALKPDLPEPEPVKNVSKKVKGFGTIPSCFKSLSKETMKILDCMTNADENCDSS